MMINFVDISDFVNNKQQWNEYKFLDKKFHLNQKSITNPFTTWKKLIVDSF